MVMHYDLYGCRLEDLESARAEVERALGIELKAHSSDYLGGDYYRFGSRTGESFDLMRNFDALEGEWLEDKFKEYPILLYANQTHRPEDIEKRLETRGSLFALLRRKTI